MVSWSHGVCGEAPKAVVEGTAHLRAAREEGEGVREKEEGEGGGQEGSSGGGEGGEEMSRTEQQRNIREENWAPIPFLVWT